MPSPTSQPNTPALPDWAIAAIRSIDGQGNTPLTAEQQATVDRLAERRAEPVQIHEAFRMCRSPGTYHADPAEVTDNGDGTLTVRQWIRFPETGWSREVETYSPKARVEAMLRACPEVRAADEDRRFKAMTTGELLARLEAEGLSVSVSPAVRERTI